jgi:hypothetical protein
VKEGEHGRSIYGKRTLKIVEIVLRKNKGMREMDGWDESN